MYSLGFRLRNIFKLSTRTGTDALWPFPGDFNE